ncbi:MAG: Uma2 family endonuclease [Myxococcales bacterium]|nr:Uma2 family endonuclease [Myxococcales bacterium]
MANAVDSTAAPRFVRLRVEQLHAMLEAGILVDGEPLELLDGLLVYKDRSAVGEDSMTIGKRHNLAVKLLAALDRELEPDHHMQTQGPIAVPPHDEPEPDGAILRGKPRDYRDRLPSAADAAVVFEVADASLAHDRTGKLAIYARAGIPAYVIVNIPAGCLEVHRGPDAEGRYAVSTVLRAGETLELTLGARTLAVPVEALLP